MKQAAHIAYHAVAHAAAKRELIAKHRPAGSMPPNMSQFPKVLTEAEVIEAEEELKALHPGPEISNSVEFISL
jgi:hypothetical protein